MRRVESAASALKNNSGTAYWIAQCRALESQELTPQFHDPWAAQLAGERGRRIVQHMPKARGFVWMFATRTAILDRMIAELLDQGDFDVVINLAAGLDTRAFRMDLPLELQWFDVDRPEILAHKKAVLGGAVARCHYTSIAMDLSVVNDRRKLLAELGARGKKVLVISEGLAIYLTEAQVAELASDLYAVPTLDTWLFDLQSEQTLWHAKRNWNETLKLVNSPLVFGPAEGSAFFLSYGWREVECVSIVEQALQANRLPTWFRYSIRAARWVFPRWREQMLKSGIARMQRLPPSAAAS